MKRAVFLDRDGVLNESLIRGGKARPPACVRETIIMPQAEEELARLKRCGFLLIVITNQPDVRRGTATRRDVEDIHRLLSMRLSLDDFFVCYHDDGDSCTCRKPLPGLVLNAAFKYGIDVRKSYLIGDRWRDIDAGAAAGCRTILIDRQYNERTSTFSPDVKVSSLTAAVDWIMEQEAALVR